MKYSLKELRARNNLSQKELAQKVQLSEKTINRFEADIQFLRSTSYANVEKIANVLNVNVEDIFLG